MHLNGKKRIMSFNGKRATCRNVLFMKIFCAYGAVCPCPRVIYMYMTIIFKDL